MATFVFVWWNVHNFAHFDSERANQDRWPKSQQEFEAKAERIAAVLNSCKEESAPVDLIVLSETTRGAATYLANEFFQGYTCFPLDLAGGPSFEISVLYRTDIGITMQPPTIRPFMPRGSRPMAEFDWVVAGNTIRFFACHWPSRRGESSRGYRIKSADFLGDCVYDFLNDEHENQRHVVAMGDFNAEPFEEELKWCDANRSRVQTRTVHWSDKDVHRVRMYNTAWRFIGDTRPYVGDGDDASAAGTYYYPGENTWHTFDQVLVSPGLISAGVPHLSEEKCRIIDDDILIDDKGRPLPFQRSDDGWIGCSDHLPIRAALSY